MLLHNIKKNEKNGLEEKDEIIGSEQRKAKKINEILNCKMTLKLCNSTDRHKK